MLYIIGFGISFFLSVTLFSKKSKSIADKLLAVWLSIIGVHLLLYYLFTTGGYENNGLVISLGSALPLIHGPFLYLYTLTSTSRTSWKNSYIWHFLLFIGFCIFYGCFFLSLKNENFAEQDTSVINLLKAIFIYLSGIFYISTSIRQLLIYRRAMVQHFSNTEKINFNWLLYLIVWIGIIWMVAIFVRRDELVFGTVVIFVIWLGYFGIKQVRLFSQVPELSDPTRLNSVDSTIIPEPEQPVSVSDPDVKKIKYQGSHLSDEQVKHIHSQLMELMRVKQLFRNPELTLDELAAQLQVHPNILSQVINSLEHKNFYDYINGMRIENFIQLIAQPENKKYTILALAFECGFNSKAAFNRNFKKITDLTPSEYIRKQKDTSAAREQ